MQWNCSYGKPKSLDWPQIFWPPTNASHEYLNITEWGIAIQISFWTYGAYAIPLYLDLQLLESGCIPIFWGFTAQIDGALSGWSRYRGDARSLPLRGWGIIGFCFNLSNSPRIAGWDFWGRKRLFSHHDPRFKNHWGLHYRFSLSSIRMGEKSATDGV